MVPTKTYDVIVAGVGAGGMTAAAVAAAQGLKVLLVEKREPLHGRAPRSGSPPTINAVGRAVISREPDADIADSCRWLHQAGVGHLS
jgi:pyruvate/2-oxoglutarate dehydrogenase complex dihydrolipoamide dehydrogenase (E3) component